MNTDRSDRVVVVLGTTTHEIDMTVWALAIFPLEESNEHATVWLPTNVPRQSRVTVKSTANR